MRTKKEILKAFGIETEANPQDISKPEMSEHEQRVHADLMHELQQEWEQNVSIHKERRLTSRGIRSSQMSALIALLVKKGVLE